MGYIGQRMSERAREAYDCGEMPRSKWTKEMILREIEDYGVDESLLPYFKKLSLDALKCYFLIRSSWHHTGKYFQETDFYSIDYNFLRDTGLERLLNLIEEDKERKERVKAEKAVNTYITAYVDYLTWEGTRKHPKPVYHEEVVFFRGNDKMVRTSNGNKRLTSLNIHRQVEQKTKYAPEKKVMLK